MMIVAHDCQKYGVIAANGQPLTDEAIARRCGCTLKEYVKLLAELDAAGVPRRDDAGAIFSKRMVSDGEIRAKRAAGGDAGADHGKKGGRPKQENNPSDNPSGSVGRGRRRGFQNNPPSSSSSSSSSPSGEIPPTSKVENDVEIPLNLDTPRFRLAWQTWIADRKARKKPMTPHAEALQLRKLSEWGEARAIAAIEHSIASSYTGIYEPTGGHGPALFPTKAQRSEDEFADIVEGSFPEVKQ